MFVLIEKGTRNAALNWIWTNVLWHLPLSHAHWPQTVQWLKINKKMKYLHLFDGWCATTIIADNFSWQINPLGLDIIFFCAPHASEFHSLHTYSYDNLLDGPSFEFMWSRKACKSKRVAYFVDRSHWQATEEDGAHKLNWMYAIYLKEVGFHAIQLASHYKTRFFRNIMRYFLSDFTDEFIKYFKPCAERNYQRTTA